ncbi:energy transducer TonB [Pectobacterium cacticida]|uniref:energy transducer TonB n=1 Tax=Pectobacterium cacticida TaxID=69221 RepID=UPI002FF0BD58
MTAIYGMQSARRPALYKKALWLATPLLVMAGHLAVIALLLRDPTIRMPPPLSQTPAAAPIAIELAALATSVKPQVEMEPAATPDTPPPPPPEAEIIQSVVKEEPKAVAKLTVREKPDVKHEPRKQKKVEKKRVVTPSPARQSQQQIDNSNRRIADVNRAPQVGATSDATLKANMSWQSAILARLQKEKRYPAFALRTHQQDTILLRFFVDERGNVTDVSIVKSRGYSILDKESLDLVKRVSPLPKPPTSTLKNGSAELIVPIQFYITEKS